MLEVFWSHLFKHVVKVDVGIKVLEQIFKMLEILCSDLILPVEIFEVVGAPIIRGP